jgi:hypothetical protein
MVAILGWAGVAPPACSTGCLVAAGAPGVLTLWCLVSAGRGFMIVVLHHVVAAVMSYSCHKGPWVPGCSQVTKSPCHGCVSSCAAMHVVWKHCAYGRYCVFAAALGCWYSTKLSQGQRLCRVVCVALIYCSREAGWPLCTCAEHVLQVRATCRGTSESSIAGWANWLVWYAQASC